MVLFVICSHRDECVTLALDHLGGLGGVLGVPVVLFVFSERYYVGRVILLDALFFHWRPFFFAPSVFGVPLFSSEMFFIAHYILEVPLFFIGGHFL
jgi:hypothetical protein